MYISRLFKNIYRKLMPLKIRKSISLYRLFFKDKKTYNNIMYWREQKKKYGKLNPGKKFYVLRKHPENMGILSCYLTYLGQLELIEGKMYIPVVDMMSHYYPEIHNTEEDFNRVNAWENFFMQLSNYALKEVYASRKVILGLGRTTENAMELFDDTIITNDMIQKWHELDKKYVRLNKELCREFQKVYESLLYNKRVVGVMIREGYMILDQIGHKVVKNHPVQPKIEKLILDLQNLLICWKCDYIFLLTESMQTLDKMKNSFGDKLLYIDKIRMDTSFKNSNDFENKWREYIDSAITEQRIIDYLKDVYLLSKCTCLLSGKSSATVVACIWNGNKYENRYIYNLGTY